MLGEAEMMVKSILLNKGRWAWLLLSTAAMFVSAYSVFGWMGAVGRISGWVGLPQYEAQIPRLRAQAELAVALPFLAAWFLGLGRKDLSLPRMLSGAKTFQISDHQFKPLTRRQSVTMLHVLWLAK